EARSLPRQQFLTARWTSRSEVSAGPFPSLVAHGTFVPVQAAPRPTRRQGPRDIQPIVPVGARCESLPGRVSEDPMHDDISPEHILQVGSGFWASKTLLSA